MLCLSQVRDGKPHLGELESMSLSPLKQYTNTLYLFVYNIMLLKMRESTGSISLDVVYDIIVISK